MTSKNHRHDNMTVGHQQAMGDLPRTHENCMEKTGVSRPGKTAHDKVTGAWTAAYVRHQRKIDKQSGVSS